MNPVEVDVQMTLRLANLNVAGKILTGTSEK